GEISENGKGGGWWGASAHGGQAARLTHSSAETGFAQKCKIAPSKKAQFMSFFYFFQLFSSFRF
ncbi:hypothetical protein KBC31_04420, partial [Candidatus Saccharibacteria bacterium]|nr:hypothetical protein [Candidatus Saccharibacteria bacterium]